ncbi:MAG: DoxX family protein [Candidatus Heimdallarchaeota archaeon]|nr:DoxX family protein [Candidatus Heimdallarchaeota archaeon]
MSLDFFTNLWKKKDLSAWLVVIRLLVGIEWFMAGLGKVLETAPTFPEGMAGTLGFFASANPNTWYVNLINNSFLPNAELFGYLVMLGELIVGITLILGLFTNFSAIASIFMNLNFFFAAAHLSPSTSSINWMMAGLGFVLLLGYGSKTVGLDSLIGSINYPLYRIFVDWFGFDKSMKAVK